MPEFDFEGDDIGGNDSVVDDAFAQAFRRAEGLDTEAPTDEVTPGDEPAADDEGQPRDEQGRFARTQPEVTDLEGEQAAHEQELEQPAVETEETDPEVASFLAKYGNDPEKALRAAVELSKLQGRQGDELGQLRQTVEQLQQRLEQPAQPRIAITEQVVEELDSLAVEQPQQALSRAAQMDPSGQLTERVMDIWFATNPRQASAFQAALIASETERRVRAEIQPITAERAQTAEDRRAVEAWSIALGAKSDLNEKADAIREVFEARPGLAKAALAAETPEELAQYYIDAYELANPSQQVVDPQVREVAEQQQREAAVTARRAATVVKPSAVGSPPGAEKQEQSEEDRIRAGILGAKSTDILSGLTSE